MSRGKGRPSTGAERARQAKRAAVREKLPELLAKQEGLCYWCREPIVVTREVPLAAIVDQTHEWVLYRDAESGEKKEAGWASVDHIKPLALGGDNEESNLVAACKRCNEGRAAVRRAPKAAKKCDLCSHRKHDGPCPTIMAEQKQPNGSYKQWLCNCGRYATEVRG